MLKKGAFLTNAHKMLTVLNDPSKPIKKVPTMVKNLLEENRGQQVISVELQVDLHRPFSEMVSDLTKKANRIDISV